MEGFNSVRMRGYLMGPKLTYTGNGFPKFTGRISIPIQYKAGDRVVDGKAFYNVSAWGSVAEALGEMRDETPVEIDGQLNSRSYDGACKGCGQTEKKYWTEVQINNFIVLDE